MKNSRTMKIMGIASIVMSCVVWLIIPAMPWIPISKSAKIIATTALVISGEVFFWGGGLILGREVVKKFRDRLNPLKWFRRKKVDDNQEGA